MRLYNEYIPINYRYEFAIEFVEFAEYIYKRMKLLYFLILRNNIPPLVQKLIYSNTHET